MPLKPFLLAAAALAFAAPASAQSGAAAPPGTAPAAEHPLAAPILQAAQRSPELADLYAPRGGAPVWAASGGPLEAAPLLAALERAPDHALPAARYGAEALRRRLSGARALDPAGRAALDLDLTRALALYAGDLSAGALVPGRVDKEIHLSPERPAPAELARAALAAPDLGRWLARLGPQDRAYAALREVYDRLRREARAGGWRARLSEGGLLRPGDTGQRVTQLRARLAELGDPAPQTPRPELYDDGLEAAVKAFQRRHGLNDDGLAGRRTFAALGADVGWRLRQVAVNLERMRWTANDDLGRRHIIVNQPDFTMRVVEDGETVHAARVVVGKRRHRTPEFTDTMTHLVVNPTWNVPRSIATNEILPALKEDPTYLAKENMRLTAADGGPVPQNPAEHDWSQYDRGFFPYRVTQRPGPDNALGRVKFMFPNRFSIYLHDTPSKHLFARDGRAFSHGCVRVEDPYELAYLLLDPQLEAPRETFAEWLEAGRERWVKLEQPLTVRLTYRTAWVDDSGRAQFREDIYGRDANVWAALEAAGVGL
jgi:murein L,D-transpeptidase YcbB/YkuD